MDLRFSVFLLSADEKMPLFKELWYQFYDNYINDQTVYENLNMNGMLSVQGIVIGLFIGLALAAIAMSLTKTFNNTLVTRLLENECLTAEKGKSLPELDLADRLYLRYAVRHSVNLRRVVKCREEEEYEAKMAEIAENYTEKRKENPKLPRKFNPRSFKVDPDNHHFYIPEEQVIAAKTKFNLKGNSLLTTLLFVGLLFVAFVIVMVFLPNILTMLDNFAGFFSAA